MRDNVYNSPNMDSPLWSEDSRTFCIATTPRSGSTLLSDLLRQNDVGIAHEYFQSKGHMRVLEERFGAMRYHDDKVSMDLDCYVNQLKRHRTTPKGWFGFKIFWEDFAWLQRSDQFKEYFSPLQFIYLYRKDILAQAVSLLIAGQSGQWNSLQQVHGTTRYDANKIIYNVSRLNDYIQLWINWLAQSGMPYSTVCYEDLLQQPDRMASELDTFLKLEQPLGFNFDAVIIRPQSTSLNEQWIAKFRREHKSFCDNFCNAI